jgi:hypothetical protein
MTVSARYRRLAACRGNKRALVAVGHAVLLAAWKMLSTGTDYTDLGPDDLSRATKPARRAAQPAPRPRLPSDPRTDHRHVTRGGIFRIRSYARRPWDDCAVGLRQVHLTDPSLLVADGDLSVDK